VYHPCLHPLVRPAFTPYPPFQWYLQSNEIFSMKCWNPAFKAQGSRIFIVVAEVGAVKIYVAAAVDVLKKEEIKLSLPPKLVEKLVWVPVICFCRISFPNKHFDALLCRSHPPNRPTLQITLILYTQKLLWVLYKWLLCARLCDSFTFYFQCWVSSCGGGLSKVRLHHEVLLLLLSSPIIMFLAASQTFIPFCPIGRVCRSTWWSSCKFEIHVGRSTWKKLGFCSCGDIFVSVIFIFFNFVMLL
jgi:hypothetical protein